MDKTQVWQVFGLVGWFVAGFFWRSSWKKSRRIKEMVASLPALKAVWFSRGWNASSIPTTLIRHDKDVVEFKKRLREEGERMTKEG